MSAALQLPAVRAWLLEQVLRSLNRHLNGRVSIGDLRLRGISGVELQNITVQSTDGDTLLHIPSLRFAYEPLALSQRRIILPTVFVESPSAVLVRGRDGLWNIEHLLPRDTTTGEPPRLSIWLRGFGIRSATVLLADSLAPAAPGVLGQARWHLHHGELRGSALLLLHQRRISLTLRPLRFREALSGLSVEHLQGHITLSPSGLRLEGLQLRLPGLGLRAHGVVRLRDTASHRFQPELFLKFGSVEGNLTLDSLRLLRLRQWFPELPPIAETGRAQLHYSGNSQELRFTLLEARLGEAHLSASGTLSLPLQPHRQRVEGIITTGFVPTRLLASMAPGFPSEGRRLRFLRLHRLAFSLSDDSAEVHGRVTTGIGRAEVSLRLAQWNAPQPSYSLRLRTPGLDLGELLPRSVPRFVLAGTLEAEGTGQKPGSARLRLRLQAETGFLGPFRLQNFRLTCRLTAGLLQLDTAALHLLTENDTAAAYLTGWIDFRSRSSPPYQLALALQRFPAAALLGDTALPSVITATVQLSARGLHPDSLEGTLHAHVEALEYPEWSLVPFDISLQLSRPSPSARLLRVTGDYLTAEFAGNWQPSTLPGIVRGLSVAAAEWLSQRIRLFSQHGTPLPMPPALAGDAELRFRVEARDLVWLEHWTAPLLLQGSLSIEGWLRAAPDTAVVQIEQLAFRHLTLTTQDTVSLELDHLHGSQLSAGFGVQQRRLRMANLRGHLTLLSLRRGEQYVDSLRLAWNVTEGTHSLELSATVPELLGLSLVAQVSEEPGAYRVQLPLLRLTHYPTGFRWDNPLPILLSVRANGLSFESVVLERQGFERLSVEGELLWDSLSGVYLTLLNARLEDALRLLPPSERRRLFSGITGHVDSLRLGLSGTLARLWAELSAVVSELRYEGSPLGTLQLTARVHDSVLSGGAILQHGSRRLRLVLSSCPSRPALFARIPFEARLEATEIEAALLSPFLTELRDVEGTLNASLTVRGHLPSELRLEGRLTGSELRFRLLQTGLAYRANLDLRFRGQTLVVEEFALRNMPQDLPEGSLTVQGTIGLRELRPWSLDLRISSPQFLVLSPTAAPPTLPVYGLLILSTGQPPLQLTGTWEHPRLTGTLLIRRARLIFPAEALTESTPSSLLADYYWHTPSTAPTEEPPMPSLRAEPGFADRLFYDLRLYMLSPLSITLDLAPTQQLIADLEPENPTIPLAYVTGPEGKPQLLGRLRLLPGSVYKFYRNFTATGIISFTTGQIDNPELDIEVRYRGTRIHNNQRQSYEIRFTVRGTRRNLSIGNWGYTIAGVEGTGDENQLFNDVIWLLLVGQTQQELEGSLGSNGALGQEIPLANLSTLASKAATDLFRGLGIVQDVQIDPTTGTFDLEQMRARITGQLGGVTVRWGGTLGNPLQMAEFTVDIPLSELLRGETSFLRQVLLQLSTTTGSTTVTLPSTHRLWEVRLSIRL